MSKPTVAVAMIVEGNAAVAPMLAKCLGSINGYVDAIYIQLNAPKGKKISPKVRAIADQYADVVYEYQWKGNFVEARNDVFSKVDKKYDWVMWLDVDDTVENPEQIQPVLAIMPDSVNGLYIMYDYAHDDAGNVTVSHWTSRVVRNNGTFIWKSSIDDEETSVHETLNAVRQVRSVSNNEWKVIHHADQKRREASLFRNIDILQSMYERQSKAGKVDPRILFYLATHLYDGYDFQIAKNLFADYLELSGWNEERSEAHVYLGRILKMEKNEQRTRVAFLMALGENPKNTNAYLELAKLEFSQQRFNQSIEWLRMAVAVKQEITPMVQFNNQGELFMLLAESLANVGGKSLDESLKWATKALKLRPYDDQYKEARDRVLKLIEYRDNIKASNRLIRQLEKDSENDKIISLLDSLPIQINDSAPVISARQKYTPAVKWPKKSIAIYVGNSSLGIWGPWSLNEGGIGGSEEAVVRLSRELSAKGWKVTIYGTPGEKAGFDLGADYCEWRQYWEFNTKDEFDILIAWRQPNFFDFPLKARKKYLWLHDVMPKEEFTEDRIKNFDRAIFVSQYHADLPEFAAIPSNKKFVSSNGITPSDFDKYDNKFRRDPHRLIYMSANERGLKILYDIWPDVKKSVPKATLDVYYGWESFDAINRDNPERMAWKASMVQKAQELDGVTERGRIGQDDLNKEIFKSGIFAYPCFFPEVNCITAQKAMAGGAVPVTSDYAVLKDIITYGEQVPMNIFEAPDIERYKQHLISWLLYPEKQDRIRKDMMLNARKVHDWKLTASKWDKEML